MLNSRDPPPFVALTIAGHDPSSGAGITADLQTFAAHGLFGTSALTALTVQSTQGVAEIEPVHPDLLRRTLDHLCHDLPPAGVKIGMLGSSEIVTAIAEFLAPRSQQGLPIVLDPILRATSGAALLPSSALETLHERLLPLVTWITPNWAELAALTNAEPISNPTGAEAAMRQLGRRHPHLTIVATGGDNTEPIDLLRLPSGAVRDFAGEHIESSATHGTGCAFSSALLARLIEGSSPVEAVSQAKYYVLEAIRQAAKLGYGKGPLNLLWPLNA